MDINAILAPILDYLATYLTQDGIDLLMEYVSQAIAFIMGLFGG